MQKKWLFCFILIIAMPAIFLGCHKKKTESGQMPPRPVETAIVIQKDMIDYIDSFGNLKALENVDIKSRVRAQIKEVHFKEGDFVKKDQLLFTMDYDIYKAAVDKAQANLEGDIAKLEQSKLTTERYRKLREKELISAQEFDNYKTDTEALTAMVEADKAELETGRLNLEYCKIISPIEGVSGIVQVDPGNIVEAYIGPVLVNIKKINPLYVDFTISERRLFELKNAMAKSNLQVEVTFEDYTNVFSGTLEIINNQIDNTTGTILLRAAVNNIDHMLWPDQFVNVRLILGINKDSLLVPYSSVQMGRDGAFVFIVNSENKIEYRLIKEGLQYDRLVAISGDVKVGEKVVTVGQLGLWPGAPVVEVCASARPLK